MKLKATLKWDPNAQRFAGVENDDANALFNRASQESWQVENEYVQSR